MKRLVVASAVVLLFGGIGGAILMRSQAQPNDPPATDRKQPEQKTQPKSKLLFDKGTYSLTDATSPWIVVNKARPLQPSTYTPEGLRTPDVPLRSNVTAQENQLRPDAAAAVEKLVAAAKSEGVYLNLQSAYRSYNFQTALYNRYVREQGQAVADTQSARPGHSEHQTGLAADLGGITQPGCNIEECFAQTP